MKRTKLSLLVVDLSTSTKTAGARIVPLVDYFVKSNYQVSLLMNQATRGYYLKLFGQLAKKITIKAFPFSKNFPSDKFLVGLEYLKRIVICPFVRINKDADIIYSLTGIICDVFPSFVFKLKSRNVWVANVDNLEAPPSQKPGSYFVNLFSFLLFRFSVFLLRWADAVFITTPLKEVKTTLVKGGIRPERIILSNNGIPFDYIQKITKPSKVEYSAVFMGRIHQGKGVFDLIKIWAKVVNRLGSNQGLLVLGSGDKSTSDKFKGLIQKKDLQKNVSMPGFIKDLKTKYSFLKSAKVFLYPSYYDANPISTVEALACGLPIVAYDLPIFVEHYPKNIIEIVPKGDTDSFAQKTIAFLTDENRRKKVARVGIKWAKNSSWEEIFREQERVIRCLKE